MSRPGRTVSSSRHVLMIAYHFPPVRGSSGMQRTLRFAEHLRSHGWQPVILSISEHAYEQQAASAGNEVPQDVAVHRAFGLDAARHLAIRGRYPGFAAIPDRWASWRPFAVAAARRILRKQPIDAIWSTFPIATAHCIGLEVARASGLPWIAEFRDPMWQGDYPPDPRVNQYWKALEGRVFAQASRVVVTTPGARDLYRERFPAFDPANVVLIENGYDEPTFMRAEQGFTASAPGAGIGKGPVKLLHSGIIYPSERDPTQLFAAVAALKQSGRVTAGQLQIVLRGSGHADRYRRQVTDLGISDIIELADDVSYLDALREMLAADALLLLQASNCNAQIPAKLYEYLRARRPLLALTDPAGDTAQVLRDTGAAIIGRLDSAESIAQSLMELMDRLANGTWPQATAATVARYSRAAQAGQLAGVLDKVVEPVRP